MNEVPHGEEPVKILIEDVYQAVDLTLPARPDLGKDMRQGPAGPGPKPDDEKNKVANKENQGEDDPMEGRSDKVSEVDLGALERDLFEYDCNETEGGGANITLC